MQLVVLVQELSVLVRNPASLVQCQRMQWTWCYDLRSEVTIAKFQFVSEEGEDPRSTADHQAL